MASRGTVGGFATPCRWVKRSAAALVTARRRRPGPRVKAQAVNSNAVWGGGRAGAISLLANSGASGETGAALAVGRLHQAGARGWLAGGL